MSRTAGDCIKVAYSLPIYLRDDPQMRWLVLQLPRSQMDIVEDALYDMFVNIAKNLEESK